MREREDGFWPNYLQQMGQQVTFNSGSASLEKIVVNPKIDLCWGQIFHKTWNLFHWQLAPHQQIMDFGKTSFKAQKSYINKMMLKPMVQNPWWYYLIKAHSSSSCHNISFSTHDPSSWVSSEEFWESWFGGLRNMFSKVLVVRSWWRKTCYLMCLPQFPEL